MPVSGVDARDIERLVNIVRRRVLRRFAKLGVISKEAARDMLNWPHGGFSLDASVCVGSDDRAGLERVLNYCMRPAVALKRLEYSPEQDLVRYRPPKERQGCPCVLEWKPVEFLKTFCRLIPHPRYHLVRYAGALGPRARIRAYVMEAARRNVAYQELVAGWEPPSLLKDAAASIADAAKKVSSAGARAWAACLKRVFEIEPLLCPKCGIEMTAVAAITQDSQLERLLRHLGLPAEFPRTKPARSPSLHCFSRQCQERSPPLPAFNEECQLDPIVDSWYGIDDQPPGYWAAA